MPTRIAPRALGWQLLVLVVLACGGTTGPEGDLAPGTYEVSFTVEPSPEVPVALTGDHQFAFRVTDPEDASSFTLLSSRFRDARFGDGPGGWQEDYLAPTTEHIVGGLDEWRVRWQHRERPPASVRVEVTGADGSLRARDCGVIPAGDATESGPARSCEVERVDAGT